MFFKQNGGQSIELYISNKWFQCDISCTDLWICRWYSGNCKQPSGSWSTVYGINLL